MVNGNGNGNVSDNPNSTVSHAAELQMTAGMIADLANAQSTQEEDGGIMEGRIHVNMHKKSRADAYEPLKPFELPLTAKEPHIEAGRVDIRLMALMDTLSKVG
eukprot:CAMPEP_0197241390 /NCGR_PEP_ID=MMETSP1429-20130617/7435_1 /TAXON_ID=49237 /ORGANISM="Chaetoceros  sp., Strain UNC1202" /LENGTH=102 /DNA_ID=CAMNT_0042701215 /DNA_START=213 /DNA_END=521 /DNA_ORIENTATION=-